MDIHVKLHNTEVYRNGVISMGTKLCNNLPGFIKEIDDYEAFKKELKNYSFFVTLLLFLLIRRISD